MIVKPEKGRTARMDKELEEKLAAYKAGLSEEERNRLVAATKELEAYQESEDAPEDMVHPGIKQRRYHRRMFLFIIQKRKSTASNWCIKKSK